MRTALAFTVLWASTAMAQVFPVDHVINNGPQANRINLVFLGDGYTASQQTTFLTDVNKAATAFFNTSPLKEYKSFFNVYAVEVTSPESGAKHPGTAADCSTANPQVPVLTANTLLDATFDYGGGTHRLLYTRASSVINSILQTNTPFYDKALVLVNTPYYGGSGGTFAIGSTNTSSAEIMIHEFGHSFVGLADEYSYGGNCNGSAHANVTQASTLTTIPWSGWIDAGTPIPTPAATLCGLVGLYEGANYCPTGWFRPQCNCKMNSLGVPFCRVCGQAFIEKIMTSVSLIDGYAPSTSTLSLSGGVQGFSVTVLAPTPDTISRRWEVDFATVATGNVSYMLDVDALTPGSHTVTFVAQDVTPMSKATLPAFSVNWTVVKTSDGGIGVPDAGVPDAGSGAVDAGRPDAGLADAGRPDAGGVIDAGRGDAGVSDAGGPDAGTSDAGGSDAGDVPDSGSDEDGGTVDADAGDADGGPGDAGFPEDADAGSPPVDAVQAPLEGVIGSVGCGCRNTAPGAWMWWLVSLPLLGRRRRMPLREKRQ